MALLTFLPALSCERAPGELPEQLPDYVLSVGEPSGNVLKPLLGVNAGPDPTLEGQDAAAVGDTLREMGVRSVRTHDYFGPLDMSTMFPDETADPEDPSSYDFRASDSVFQAILDAGLSPYLRICDSRMVLEGYPRPRRIVRERESWSRSVVYVASRYTSPDIWGEGAARYVEIMNEPNSPSFWHGDTRQAAELFTDAVRAVSHACPGVQVGGPGFLFKEEESTDVPVKVFLEVLVEEEVTPDFVSFHVGSTDPAEYLRKAALMRGYLDDAGLTDTELHLTEWGPENLQWEGGSLSTLETGEEAALLTACWITLQGAPVERAFFYRATTVPEAGFTEPLSLLRQDGTMRPAAEAFGLWSETADHRMVLHTTISSTESYPLDMQDLRAVAGCDSTGGAVLLLASLLKYPVTMELDVSWVPLGEPLRMETVVFDPDSVTFVTDSLRGRTMSVPSASLMLLRLPPRPMEDGGADATND